MAGRARTTKKIARATSARRASGSDKQPPTKPSRATDRRVQEALAEARKEEWALERRIAAEKEAAAREQAERAVRQRTERVEAARAAEQDASRKRAEWPLGPARALVRQGYSPQQASRMTGWPVDALEDADRIFDAPRERGTLSR